jgi:hypothetical protein
VTRFAELLQRLSYQHVDFIVVGGLAAAAHGSPRVTQDIDVVYRRSSENIAKLVAALEPVHPYLRGAPPGLPFRLDAATVEAGLNFTLITELGWIDLLGEIAGGGRFENLASHCVTVDVFGIHCRVLDLETLIQTKRAAGRPKDFEALAELEILRTRKN